MRGTSRATTPSGPSWEDPSSEGQANDLKTAKPDSKARLQDAQRQADGGALA